MSSSAKITEVLKAPKSNGFWQNAFRRFRRNHLAMVSLIFIVFLAFLCAVVPMISHYDYSVPDFSNSLVAPGVEHFFGSDGLGRDLFVRSFIGGRITFEIAFVAVAAMSWLDMARVVRGQTLSLRHKEFVEAAHVCGVGNWQIITKHIIPNLIGVVIVYAALVVPNMIVLSAVLSFFGLGVMEPMTSWGLLISDGAQNMTSWWLLLFPALLMTSTLLAFAFVANGLRDALDPR